MYKLIASEKFHSMQATVETVQFDDGMMVKRLVSYDSVVCDIITESNTLVGQIFPHLVLAWGLNDYLFMLI